MVLYLQPYTPLVFIFHGLYLTLKEPIAHVTLLTLTHLLPVLRCTISETLPPLRRLMGFMVP